MICQVVLLEIEQTFAGSVSLRWLTCLFYFTNRCLRYVGARIFFMYKSKVCGREPFYSFWLSLFSLLHNLRHTLGVPHGRCLEALFRYIWGRGAGRNPGQPTWIWLRCLRGEECGRQMSRTRESSHDQRKKLWSDGTFRANIWLCWL